MLSRVAVVGFGLLLLSPTPSLADEEDPPELGWGAEAKISYVQASGNSDANTLGLKARIGRKWKRSQLELKASGLRASSGERERTAVGTEETFVVEERSTSELKAENYLLNGRLERKVSERFFWNVGAAWERDRFAGIDNRTQGVLGVGNTLIDRERLKLKTTYGATLTHVVDVDEAANADRTFLGAQLTWALEVGLGKNAKYTSTLDLDDNLEEVEDFRADMVHGLSASVTSHLALKVSLQWLYRNRPALVEVPLSSPAGEASGTVLVPLEKLDTKLTTALVMSF
jgi:putative salt-induced outer membrane protein YdiY